MRQDLVNKVTEALKGIIPYKENIIWEDFKSICILGRYKCKENKIQINSYLEEEQTILNVMAHELIHACGVHRHGKEFRKYMNLINSLNLGFTVSTNGAKEKKEKFDEVRKETIAKRKPPKEYITWCKCCGTSWISHRKHHKISHWRCSRCGGKLGQKIYKDGVTIRWGRSL